MQGWVSLLTVLLVVRPWIQPSGVSASAQLWEPERRAKSLGFLGKGEDGQITEIGDNGVEEVEPEQPPSHSVKRCDDHVAKVLKRGTSQSSLAFSRPFLR